MTFVVEPYWHSPAMDHPRFYLVDHLAKSYLKDVHLSPDGENYTIGLFEDGAFWSGYGFASEGAASEVCKRLNKARGKPTSAKEKEAPLPQSPPAKDTNPKDMAQSKRARWFSYLPIRPLMWVGLACMEGARKYGLHNWRDKGVLCSVYLDAAVGHLSDFKEGQDIDPASGIHHIYKSIAGLLILADAIEAGNWIDDRPYKVAEIDRVRDTLDAKAAEIIARYPECKAPLTEVSRADRKD